MLGRVVAIGALSVTTLTYAKAEGISVEGAKADSVFIRGGKAYELDGVTVTGSRAPMTVELSPKIVTVMTREDIQRSAAQTINDVLKLATGVDVRQRGGFGVQTDISINGGTFDQILDTTLVTVPCALGGARLYHCITTPADYFPPTGN